MTTEQITLDFTPRPTLIDQAARDTARTLVDSPVVVAAGAGAGKTEALIRRLETVLGAEAPDPDRIVAITFTERAARDLVNKLRTKLPAPLIPHIELMRVGTIHSFCLGILRRHPLEAGLPPVFTTQDELMSGADAAGRINRIRDAFFDRVAELGDPVLRQAIELYVSKYRLGMLHDLIRLVDQQWDRFAEVSFDPPGPWNSACAAIEDHIAMLAADPATPARLRELFTEICDGLTTLGASESMVSALASIPPVKLSTNGGAAWKEVRDDVKARVASIAASVYECALGSILHVLVPIVLGEAELRYQRGQLSFDDILVLTRRLLTDRPEVRARLRGEIDHLCVDEFQDTDIVQYDIVRMLTDAVDASGDHRPVLFAVGDPKQSIYGFREADVALFEELRSLPDLTQLELSTNFRSRPAIIRWVNEVFAQWFAADAGQVPFAPLADHVPDSPAFVTVVGGRI
ncbi:MAG: UvrD-helicase domain-containing protein, partial [Ilumatobacteraceae bacterium]